MPFMRPGGILCAGGWAQVIVTTHFRTNKSPNPLKAFRVRDNTSPALER
jgi:hypothetical protein